jgi:hypothetical protein
LAIDAITSSEGVSGDDPSTGRGKEETQEPLEETAQELPETQELLEERTQDSLEEEATQEEEEEVKEDGSEGHLPIHPGKVSVTVTGGHLAAQAITLWEGVGEDDLSVSSVTLGIIDAALRRPILNGGEDPNDGPEKIRPPRFKPWISVGDAIERRHVKGRKDFRARKRQVKRGEYEDRPPKPSWIAEQAEWESVDSAPILGEVSHPSGTRPSKWIIVFFQLSSMFGIQRGFYGI